MVTVFVHENLQLLGNLLIETKTAILILIQKLIFSDFLAVWEKVKLEERKKKKKHKKCRLSVPCNDGF